MNEWQLLLILIFISLLLLALYYGSRWWSRALPEPPVALSPPEDLVQAPVFLSFKEPVAFRMDKPQYEAQSRPWQDLMRSSGRVLDRARVSHIVFLHGTFVGSDPLDLLPPLRSFLPQMYEKMEPKLQNAMRGLVNRLAGDNGNFLPAYVSLFEESVDHKLQCHLLHWSSANHHIARLLGALRLLEFLLGAQAKDSSMQGRILLIGHSHARQVFGLFTHLVGQSPTGKALWQFMREQDLVSAKFAADARSLERLTYDFVTLGGPVRYAWAFLPGMRALHFINHRGSKPQVDQLLGFWHTANGDYIQQWGTIGSDTLATTTRERQFNRELDALIGKGSEPRLWLNAVVRRERLGNFGRTLLIDYGDQGRFRPNFMTTVFGHGIYTRYQTMLYQTLMICRYLYETELEESDHL